MARLLIVDDSPVIKKMLSKMIVDNGHSVVATGKDGHEAIDLYREHKPDILLLDITMPNKSGIECLEEIISDFPTAKVIMFSSISDEKSRQACIDLGAKAFINKDINLFDPSKVKEILGAIEAILEN